MPLKCAVVGRFGELMVVWLDGRVLEEDPNRTLGESYTKEPCGSW